MPKNGTAWNDGSNGALNTPITAGKCLIDPECFYRVEQQVEINTKKK